MKHRNRLGLFVIAFCAILLSQSFGQQFFHQYENYTLPNGFKTILIPMRREAVLIAYYTVVRTGSRDEWEPGKKRICPFLNT